MSVNGQNELKELMFFTKKKWQQGEFDTLYNQLCFGQIAYDVFDVINIEFYIAEAIKSGAYSDQDIKGLGTIMLGFFYGDILKRNLKNGKWRFSSHPKDWNDFYIEYRGKSGTVSLLPFSRVSRFIDACYKLGFQKAMKSEEASLVSLLEQIKKM